MKTYRLLVLLLLAAATAKSQEKYTSAVAGQIKEVENNLGGWVKIQDSTGWNILDRMAYYQVNGLTIAVIHNYKVEWVKGYGWADSAQKIPVTPATMFQVASIGKSITAAGMMKLVQEGKVDLNRDINDYLKSWKFPYDTASHGRKITLFELLSHTAGLSVHGFDGYKWGQPLPTIIHILNGAPPANSAAVRSIFELGTKFEYSGGGYEVAELMVEDITGEDFARYIQHTIFKPLGMKRSFYFSDLPGEEKKNLPTAYRFDGKAIGCKYHLYPENGCGAGLWSTPSDFAKFIVELQLSLQNNSNKILSEATTGQLFTPPAGNDYGLGFFIVKKGDQIYIHHSGLNEGFISNYYASLKDGNGVVIMANTDYLTGDKDITEEITNSVASVYGWKNYYKPVVKKEVTVADSVLNTYCGTYKFREDLDQTVTVFWKNGKLWFRDSGSPKPWLMHFVNNTDFFVHEVTFNTHSFTKDTNGKVDGFMIRASDGTFKVKKVL